MLTEYDEYNDFNSIDEDEEYETFINTPIDQLYMKYQKIIQILELKFQLKILEEEIQKLKNANQQIQQQLNKFSNSTNKQKGL